MSGGAEQGYPTMAALGWAMNSLGATMSRTPLRDQPWPRSTGVTSPAQAWRHWLNGLVRKGISSSRAGKQWTGCGIQGFMTSGFAAGLIRVGDGYLPGAQKPLIGKMTWDRFCAERSTRYPKRPKVAAPPTALAGLVYCGNCGHKTRLAARSSTHGRVRAYIYLCEGRTCDNQMWITRYVLEAQIKDWLERQATLTELAPTMPQMNSLELERQLVRIDAGLVKNRVEYAMGDYGVAMRNRVEATLKARHDEVRSRIDHNTTAAFPVNSALEIATHWDQWPPGEINEALRLSSPESRCSGYPAPTAIAQD
jgi:hypothetical protein